jgi:hypothetical protein
MSKLAIHKFVRQFYKKRSDFGMVHIALYTNPALNLYYKSK